MKFQIMLRILFTLLRSRKTTAAQLAKDNEVSERSIHRYLEELIISGVPIDIIRGRNGGIFLPDTYKLPENFFTQQEYAAAVNALAALYEQLRDDSAASALEKLQSQQKSDRKNLTLSGNILVDSGTWGDVYDFSEKLKVCERATEDCDCLDILYIDRGGQESRRTVEPHLLVYKQNVWYVYAYCHTRKAFRLFKTGRIKSARLTGGKFTRREFRREDVPLKFNFEKTELIHVRFAVTKKALPDMEEWLGIDNIRSSGDTLIAEATLPYGEPLLSKILSFGEGIKILSPESLARQIETTAKKLCELYN